MSGSIMTDLNGVIDAVASYVNREDTKKILEDRVLQPCLAYANEKLVWSVRLFQLVALLVVVQSVMLVFLLVREVRRR